MSAASGGKSLRAGRAPQGARGLKFFTNATENAPRHVAPRKGRVD